MALSFRVATCMWEQGCHYASLMLKLWERGTHIPTGRSKKAKKCCKEGKIPPSPYELRNIPFLRGLYSAKFHLLPFNFRFNTGFLSEDSPNLLLKREQLDNPHKPKLWNSFREKFQIEVIFSK